MQPTKQTYGEFQKAYDFFNKSLFGGNLPLCLITMQRKNRTYGYFSGNRWAHHEGATVTDEIALNPSHFSTRSVREVLSTLVHEQAHLWQHHYGKTSRNGYHNKQWALKMREIGLIPSSTGKPGDKETGQSVSHYIEKNGAFDRAMRKLEAKQFRISWVDRAIEAPQKPTTSGRRTKYTCPGCQVNVWAKPELNLICGECVEQFAPAGA